MPVPRPRPPVPASALRPRVPRCVRVGNMALLLLLCCGSLAQASAISSDLNLLAQGQRFERRISLATMGLPGPSVNIPQGSLQEFYFPAHARDESRSLRVETPANQPVPAFALNGVAVPTDITAPGQPNQQLSTRMPLAANAAHARLGMQVGPMPQNACEAVPKGAVALHSDSFLSYYPTASTTAPAPTPTTSAWSDDLASLPERPFLLVAAPPLSLEVFDTAWRVGLAMARMGRPVAVHTLPRVGDNVDTRGLSIPASLTALPAFASLADASEHHTIANPAEIGALLLLDAADTLADLVVVDRQLQSQIRSALDALQNQIGDAEALAVFQQWRDKKMPLSRTDAPAGSLSRVAFGAHPAWMINADGAAGIAALESRTRWQPLTAVANGAARLAAHQADHPLLRRPDASAPHQFAVQAPQNWAASFVLTPPLASAHTPSHVQASFQLPAQSRAQQPVGVLRWNGVLLEAKKLRVDSERETLGADVPVYALSAINLLTVSLEQSAPAGDCQQITPVPVTALQLDVRFGAAPAGASTEMPARPTFADLIPELGRAAELAVPQSYLTQARVGLSNTIRMALAANLSPVASRLVLVDAHRPYQPSGPFVALDIPLQGVTPAMAMREQKIMLNDSPVSGLNWLPTAPVTAVQTVTMGSQPGLLWYPLTPDAMPQPTGLLVNHGQFALLGANSEVAWLNASGSVVHAADANVTGPMYEWRSLFSWGVPVTLAMVVLFVVLLLAAMVASRRASRKALPTEGSS
ncbi:hypothetical protein SDC9_76231 [bioreactor metagenome]|uniref:Cellulose synthase regulatory subunit n=1 Tax=bioreactor metagenome TaxID=1076179 RepID=A0A644YP99_9ZZZZ